MAGILSELRSRGITGKAIADAVVRSNRPIVSGNGIKVTSGPMIGTSVSALPQPPRPQCFHVIPTGYATGAGIYVGKVLSSKFVTLDVNADQPTFTGETECYIVNTAEANGGHVLPLNVPILAARMPGMNTNTSPSRAVFYTTIGGDESTGEFQWQSHFMVSANQGGWDDSRWTAVLEDA
jgi:hypothetical protein